MGHHDLFPVDIEGQAVGKGDDRKRIGGRRSGVNVHKLDGLIRRKPHTCARLRYDPGAPLAEHVGTVTMQTVARILPKHK